ncbi:MAG TPA: metalloregulator ArsR/SmtB family transcription factor [Gemmatimonadaceae bacterium]
MNTYQAAQLDALGDATRRAIVSRLLAGPMPVGKLARRFPVSRPAISQHLKVLKTAGLVVDEQHGTRRMYALNPAAFGSLREYVDEFWNQALAAFKKRVEAPPPGKE